MSAEKAGREWMVAAWGKVFAAASPPKYIKQGSRRAKRIFLTLIRVEQSPENKDEMDSADDTDGGKIDNEEVRHLNVTTREN